MLVLQRSPDTTVVVKHVPSGNTMRITNLTNATKLGFEARKDEFIIVREELLSVPRDEEVSE